MDSKSEELLQRYAAATPDDLAVERVWQRVIKTVALGKASRQPMPLWPFVPALLASVLFWGLWLGRRPAQHPPNVGTAVPVVAASATPAAAALGATVGDVFFSRPAESWQTSQSQQALTEGERLRSDATGRAVLNVAGVASVLVAEGTDLAIERLSGGTYLRLSHGSVVARVSKRPPGEPFVVMTDRFSVKVIGTLFEVDQDASGGPQVSVREGTVQVSSADGAAYRVEAGESWRSTEPGQRGRSAISDSVQALLETGLRGTNPLDLERRLQAVTSVMPAAIETRPVARRHASMKTPLPPPTVLAERAPVVPVAAATQVPPAPTPAAGAYANGVALEQRGEFAGAAVELSGASEKDPSHADLALYALGRLYQHRLNDPQRALAAFESYRARYPQGSLRQEVDLSVLAIEVKSGDRKAALAESAQFLVAHPTSERGAEVRVLRGNLLREAGDCRAAVGEYAAAVGTTSALAEAALFGTARCQQQLGNGALAREALRSYQARFPAGPHREEVARDLAGSER